MRILLKPRIPMIILVTAVVLSACGQVRQSSEYPIDSAGTLRLVAANYPIFDFTRSIVDDSAEVRLIVPPGADPHHWEPSPRDLQDIHRSHLLLYSGVGLEHWLERLLSSAEGRLTLRDVSVGIEPLQTAGEIDPSDGSHGKHVEEHADPHLWLDPLRASQQAANIAEILAEQNPEAAELYRMRAGELQAKMLTLHQRYLDGLSHCRSRALLSEHGAYHYLAERYQLEFHSIAGLASESEPSPARMVELVKLIEERGIPAVFLEPQSNRRFAETLAHETGIGIYELNPIESITADQAALGLDYIALMEQNLRQLQQGLGCDD